MPKGDHIDDSWLTIWEREGLVALLDWLPGAKELFPLCLYNQPGGSGKAQYFIDVITCFLRGISLPPPADYAKLQSSDPSPYLPTNLICRSCHMEEPPMGQQETWLGCDFCAQWWHACCLGFTAEQAEAMDGFHCDECKPIVATRRKRSRDIYAWALKIPATLASTAPGWSNPTNQLSYMHQQSQHVSSQQHQQVTAIQHLPLQQMANSNPQQGLHPSLQAMAQQLQHAAPNGALLAQQQIQQRQLQLQLQQQQQQEQQQPFANFNATHAPAGAQSASGAADVKQDPSLPNDDFIAQSVASVDSMEDRDTIMEGSGPVKRMKTLESS